MGCVDSGIADVWIVGCVDSGMCGWWDAVADPGGGLRGLKTPPRPDQL